MQDLLDGVQQMGISLLGEAWPVAWVLIKIVAVVLPILACASGADAANLDLTTPVFGFTTNV